MRNNITPQQLVPEIFMQESHPKQNDYLSEHVSDIEARIGEIANEPEKQKASAEKGAKLMQLIWGDKFLSDSLY